MTFAISPFFKSIATRIPSLEDSSRISEIPTRSLLLTRLAILVIKFALLTW